jgi:hypothetical protein
MSLLVLTATEISHPYFLFTCLIRYSWSPFIPPPNFFFFFFFFFLPFCRLVKSSVRKWVSLSENSLELVYAKMWGVKKLGDLKIMFQRHTSRVVLFDKFPRETRIQKPNFLILAVNQIDGLGWRKCAHCVPYDTYNSYFIFLFSFLLGN